MRNEQTLELFPQPSLTARRFVFLTHAAAFAIGVFLATHNPWALLLCLFIPISLVFTLARNRSRRISRILYRGKDEWLWEYPDGHRAEGRHLGSSLRFSWLVILHLRDTDSKRITHIALPADSLSADQHRRLRIVLNQPLD